MFFKNRHKPNSRIDTLIGAETVIEGNVKFSGGLRVDGTVRGDVIESDSHGGTLVLSENGRVEGNINVSHAVINGEVVGPVQANNYVELQDKSRVTGDVRYKTIEIHMGAVIEGKLIHMEENAYATMEPKLLPD